MLVLFVHGMGRSPLSGWLMLHKLRQAGCGTETFAYVAAVETFDAIALRLAARIAKVARRDQYIVVGHSLGGVLLRAALSAVPSDTIPPKHLFLLGSPIQPSRIAAKLAGNMVFRVLAGDCGQLLGSAERMARIASVAVPVPVTGVAGIKGIIGAASPFGSELNDGVVSLSEVSAPWLAAQIQIPVIHTLLPASSVVASIIIRCIAENNTSCGQIPS